MSESPVHDELTLISYEILGLVGRGGADADELLRMARRGRMGRILDWGGERQYFAEPKRLARLGYLDARQEPDDTRAPIVYSLTEKGFSALGEYARKPAELTPIKSEALIRLLICDLVGEEVTRESLAALQSDVAELRVRLDESERAWTAYPHRVKYLMIVSGFLRRYLDAHEQLVAEVERELADSPRERPKTVS